MVSFGGSIACVICVCPVIVTRRSCASGSSSAATVGRARGAGGAIRRFARLRGRDGD
jgi:hypothetical protein